LDETIFELFKPKESKMQLKTLFIVLCTLTSYEMISQYNVDFVASGNVSKTATGTHINPGFSVLNYLSLSKRNHVEFGLNYNWQNLENRNYDITISGGDIRVITDNPDGAFNSYSRIRSLFLPIGIRRSFQKGMYFSVRNNFNLLSSFSNGDIDRETGEDYPSIYGDLFFEGLFNPEIRLGKELSNNYGIELNVGRYSNYSSRENVGLSMYFKIK